MILMTELDSSIYQHPKYKFRRLFEHGNIRYFFRYFFEFSVILGTRKCCRTLENVILHLNEIFISIEWVLFKITEKKNSNGHIYGTTSSRMLLINEHIFVREEFIVFTLPRILYQWVEPKRLRPLLIKLSVQWTSAQKDSNINTKKLNEIFNISSPFFRQSMHITEIIISLNIMIQICYRNFSAETG